MISRTHFVRWEDNSFPTIYFNPSFSYFIEYFLEGTHKVHIVSFLSLLSQGMH